ncbi:MAG: SusC/RagA family TonB-linked outer membrane protein [Bacteroidales bacterium]|nr:SusC/RagA family TonB-linked outer membrane protein [Bacteroidales bacterium]
MKKILMLFSLLLLTGTFVMAQTVQISGTVTSSEDGLAVPGVSVSVKGTTLGTITGADGKYVISVPTNTQTLVFSFIGFRTQEVVIGGRTKIDIVLEQDVFKVDEVVVVAYGTQQKRDIAGSVSTVKGDAIKTVPVQSFDQALQGKAAGVSVTLPNGVLNNPPVIRIRGFNSITSSSSPLIVVDGVPMFTGNFSGNNAISNSLADINPADIQSMDILKDASATALYGSRAANGVILITTKRGSGPKTRVTYDGYVGYTQPYHLFEMMNAEQYIEHKNRAWQNLSGPTAPQLSVINDANGVPIDTRWSDYVYRTGLQQNHAISFSGSTASTSYFLSVGYTDQEGMIKKNTYNRKNVRLNLDHKLNRFVTFGANVSYTNGKNEAPNTGASFATAGAARLAFVLPPNLSPYLNDGSNNYNIEGSAIGRMGQPFPTLGYYNPVAIFDLNKFTNETDRLLASFSGSIEPIKGLVLKTVYGIDNLSAESITFQSPVTGDSYGPNGYAGNSFNRVLRWTWTNTINYNLTLLEKLNLGFLAGTEEQRTTGNSWSGSKTNVSDPFFVSYQGSWVTAGMGGGGQGENYFVSYFGRMNLNYNKKYYLEASARRDGYSGLSIGNQFGTFGGASLMWNISNEGFISNSTLGTIVSDMRLKASYGRVGNMGGIGDFSSLFLYGSGVYGAVPTLTFSQAGNADLLWEASDKYDVGLSFGILKDKLQVDLNYFYNDVNDLILNVPQSPSKGIPGNTIPANVGSMYNTGVELTLTSYNISTADFSWTTTFNFSTLKNEVTELAPGVTEILGVTGGLETTSKTVVGQPIGNIFAVETRGVDPTTGRRIYVNAAGAEVLYSHESPAASRWTYRNGSGVAPTISVTTDGKVMGSPLPKYYGGLDNNLTYKDFDFGLGLTYAFDFDIYNGSKAGLRDQRWWNNSVEVYETAWKQDGDITNIPKPVMNDNVSNGSAFPISENIERGDYAKVRSISAGYTFKKIPGNLNIERIRLYAQAFNAYVFTKYTGSDPEVSTNGDTNLAPGIDRNSAPQSRTVTFGVNITF